MERPFSAYSGTEPYVFVSYAHDDAAAVYPLLTELRSAGYNIWYDEGISPGSTWRDEVAVALTNCDLFLFFVSPRSVASHNCQQELNYSLSHLKKTLCVHLQETVLPPGMELSLSDKQAIMRAHYGDNFLSKLVEAVGSNFQSALAAGDLAPDAEPVTAGNEKSIAVLPLENRSSDPENEYLGEGLAEEMITGLTKLPGLRVASSIASFALKGQSTDLAAMGARLGVKTILSGSVRKLGNRVRISVMLSDVADGTTLWTERYDMNMDDIFDLQDDIVRQVVDALQVELGAKTPDVFVDAGTSNADAYNEYLMGVFQHRQHTNRSMLRAVSHLRRAIDLDPDYFAPHASLLYAIYWLGTMEGDADGSLLSEARSVLERMHTLDPDKTQRGWEFEEVVTWLIGGNAAVTEHEALLRQKIQKRDELHPRYLSAVYGQYADLCRVMCLHHTAEGYLDLARPLGFDNLFWRSECAAGLGQFERAAGYLTQAIDVTPNYAVGHSDRCTWRARMGDFDGAEQDLNVLKEVWGPRHFATFNYHYWKGEMDEALACFEWLKERKRFDPYYKGACAILLGDLELGLDYFWESWQTRSPVHPIMRMLNEGYLYGEKLQQLQAEERYQALLHELLQHDDDKVSMIERVNTLTPVTGIDASGDMPPVYAAPE